MIITVEGKISTYNASHWWVGKTVGCNRCGARAILQEEDANNVMTTGQSCFPELISVWIACATPGCTNTTFPMFMTGAYNAKEVGALKE